MKLAFQIITLSLSLLTSGLRAVEVQATVISVSGKTVFSDASGQKQPLKTGSFLRPGTRISTDEKGLAILLLADGSKLSIGPNTDLTLTEMTKEGDANSNVFDLIKGLIRASVQKLTVGSKFEVASASGVAAVKGTEFEAEADEKGMEVRCKEGMVWLSDSKRENTCEIRESTKSRVINGKLEKPVNLKKEEIEHFGRWANESVSHDSHNERIWNLLRPDQKLAAVGALREALGETWNEITNLKEEERQERWRERLRSADERKLASDEAHVDFALRKTTLDRLGRRVRFNEFILRPAADKIQFLNYSKRDDRTDLFNMVNTFNKNLPHNLGETRDIFNNDWYQSNPPTYWVTNTTLVYANSGNDSLAISTWFFDPVHTSGACGCYYWHLPEQKTEVGLNISDIAHPTLAGSLNVGNGILLERWERYDNYGLGTTQINTGNSSSGALVLGNNSISTAAAASSNMKFTYGDLGAPTITDLNNQQLGINTGDMASGFKHTFSDGTFLDFRTYSLDENGNVRNRPDLIAKGDLFSAWLTLKFKTYQETILTSNRFSGLGTIDVISQIQALGNKDNDDLIN